MKRPKLILLNLILSTALSVIAIPAPLANAATTPKAGATCSKAGKTSIYKGKKFTCIKSGKKLVWDSGTTINSPQPKPAASSSPNSNQTASASPSPSPLSTSNSTSPQAKKDQSINFEKIADLFLIENSIKLSATATSGLPVLIKTESAVFCRYKADTSELLLESVGTCTVTASQSGNEAFNSAESITRTFQIKRKDQVIKYKEIKDRYLSAELIAFEASSSPDSTLNVSISVLDKNVCTFQSSKIKLLKVGTCVLQLSQSGNRFYNPAPTVNLSINVLEPIHFGTADDPQILQNALTRNGITIQIKSVTDEVSEYVCKTELIQEGCDFGGGVDADSYTRFAKIELSVKNEGSEPWIPSIFGLYLDNQLFSGDFIENNEILANYELPVLASANLIMFAALDKTIKLTDCLLFISESSAEEAFYFKLK